MKNTLTSLATAGFLLLGGGAVLAHGGQYRGPGDTVPPNPGGGSPSTPSGPSTPSAPAPSTPSAPTPNTPTAPTPSTPTGPSTGAPTAGPGRSGPTTGMAIPLFDLNEWTFWWEFNKEPYLNLKAAIHSPEGITGGRGLLGGLQGQRNRSTETMKPSLEQLRDVVTPALKRALDETTNRDIMSSCLIALAKIGQARDLDEILRKHMTSRDQEISETAVLAHGIAALEKALPDIIEIFKDTPRGRELLAESSRVNFRKQAFAGYSLGLIAYATSDSKVKRTVFEAAKEVMDSSGKFANRDIPVAAINAMRIVNPDPANPEDAKLAIEATTYLLDYLKDKNNRYQVRAHVPTAVSRLLGRDPGQPAKAAKADDMTKSPEGQIAALRSEALKLFTQMVRDKDENNMVVQSCVLALGQMAHSSDREVFRVLDQTASGDVSRDGQVRNFAIISLGYFGGDESRASLMNRLNRSASREKPWVALALGVLVAERLKAGGEADPMVGDALVNAFDKMKNPSWKAGMAVALGLARHQDAGLKIQDDMNKNRDPELRGYCAVGLGLMQFKGALDDLRTLLDRSMRTPELLKQVAIGLGLLGDRNVVPNLLKALTEGSRTVAAQAAVASGLGFVGDTRTISPLVDMLFNKDLTDRSRGYAAVALGLVGDKEDLPWNSKIGFGLNYRANVETLTGQPAGILDIL